MIYLTLHLACLVLFLLFLETDCVPEDETLLGAGT